MLTIKSKFLYWGSLFLTKFPLLENFYWKNVHGFRPTSNCSPNILKKVLDLSISYKTYKMGDYYEFGIFKGYSLWYMQRLATEKKLTKMHFFGFDSFFGLPKLDKQDASGPFHEGQYACSKLQVLDNLTRHNADLKSITLVEGFFKDTLKKSNFHKYKSNKIAIANIDCDLYSSTMSVLEFIKDLLIKNSLLIFDDWFSYSTNEHKGEPAAFAEFQKKYPNFKFKREFSYCWHGVVFRVIKI